MGRCDFCPSHATDVIRIGGGWYRACGSDAQRLEHTDRLPMTLATRRRLGLG